MIRYWFLAFRPKTLTAAIVPIVASTALVKAAGYEIHWWITFFALFSALFIQVGTNLINDAMDFKKGADTSERIGPQRVTQSGVFSFRRVFIVGSLFFLLALLFGIPLVLHGGMPILWIGLFSILFGYLYTMGPFPLAYVGISEVFVILFFGIIACMGVFYLHTFIWSWDSFCLGLQIGFLATLLLAVNNLRDREQDIKANKKTLAVRFGERFAKQEIRTLMMLTFIFNIYWYNQGWLVAFFLPLLMLPLGLYLTTQVLMTEPGIIYNRFLALAALLHLGFGLLISIGFLIT